MRSKSRSLIILSVVFGYILLQFIWWEVLLVRQNGEIISGKQKIVALALSDPAQLEREITLLEQKKKNRTFMIVGEGTVFLLLLIFGLYKIKQAMDKENALSKQQNNFFLSITHELKTPIAATKLQLQTMQRPLPDEAMRQQLIEKALKETERLNALIDNILFASRLESREFVFRKQKLNFSELLHDVMQRYFQAQFSSGEITMTSDPGITLNADAQALTSVICNLTDNAIKYSQNTREISIRLVQANGNALLMVSDKGAGIPEAEWSKVFEKFYRAGNEQTRSSKGTGLGLFIVDYIVKSHGGSIRIKKNEPRGSIFEISLPAV